MKPQTTEADVFQITPLTNSILQLILSPDQYIEYRAGQYLQIILNENPISYSIANAPLGSRNYELHIRHGNTDSSTHDLLQQIKQQSRVSLLLPFGDCELSGLDLNKPIIFIAVGTGFAPIKAMIEQLLADGFSRAIYLYWGARNKRDLYMDEKAMHWQAHVKHFNYYSSISTPVHSTSANTLASLVLTHHRDIINDCQIVMNGPFDRIYAMRDFLVANNVPRELLFSDAFSFE